MLVLTRKKNQKIKIGDNVFITIVKIDHDRVRIGIEAPNNIDVDRLEISKLRKEEKFSEALLD